MQDTLPGHSCEDGLSWSPEQCFEVVAVTATVTGSLGCIRWETETSVMLVSSRSRSSCSYCLGKLQHVHTVAL